MKIKIQSCFRYLVLLLIVSGCQTDSNYLINGHMADATSNGEWIYLVPLENATKDKVDSTKIENGAFKFQGSVKTLEIYIIRTKPILRLVFQELLIVKEPGKLNVIIGKNSTASGTVLNDTLQHWKERKMMADYLNEELKQKFKIANVAEQDVIKQKSDSLNTLILNYHFNFVRNNKQNIVGQFVQKLMAGSFSPEQKKLLDLK